MSWTCSWKSRMCFCVCVCSRSGHTIHLGDTILPHIMLHAKDKLHTTHVFSKQWFANSNYVHCFESLSIQGMSQHESYWPPYSQLNPLKSFSNLSCGNASFMWKREITIPRSLKFQQERSLSFPTSERSSEMIWFTASAIITHNSCGYTVRFYIGSHTTKVTHTTLCETGTWWWTN